VELGIIGLPQSGKTTIFNALTSSAVQTGVHTGNGSVHVGVVKVPDIRLEKLTAMYEPKKRTPATITYVDVGGISKGAASKGGLGEDFLNHMHKSDAVILVIKGFSLMDESPDPARDYRIVASEMVLSDLMIVEHRLERLRKEVMHQKRPELELELSVMEKCQAMLAEEKPIRELSLSPNEKKVLKTYKLLTEKPILLVLNYAEGTAHEAALQALMDASGLTVIPLCGTIEMDIAQMGEEDANSFLAALNIAEPALNRMIRESYKLLGLISFFTVGEDECRAWTIPLQCKAPHAAGVIHTDLEKGFIRAEVMTCQDLIEAKSEAKVKERGQFRVEGKEYVVKDGDVLSIRFNV
jgi:hypothetical protein